MQYKSCVISKETFFQRILVAQQNTKRWTLKVYSCKIKSNLNINKKMPRTDLSLPHTHTHTHKHTHSFAFPLSLGFPASLFSSHTRTSSQRQCIQNNGTQKKHDDNHNHTQHNNTRLNGNHSHNMIQNDSRQRILFPFRVLKCSSFERHSTECHGALPHTSTRKHFSETKSCILLLSITFLINEKQTFWKKLHFSAIG